MRDGYLLGLIVTGAIIGGATPILLKIAKKEKANIEEILATLTDEEKNAIKNQTYTKADGKNMFTTNGFVVNVDDEGEKRTVTVMFYAEQHLDYYIRKVKLNKSEAISKGIEKGKFVPALMKYNEEFHYYDFKKLM